MLIIVILLLLLLSMAILHIIQLKMSLKRAVKDIRDKRREATNTLLMSQSNNKEIRQLLCEFNDGAQYHREQEMQFERKNKQLQKTITNISHDLRTPLTSAMGYLELLQNHDVPTIQRQKYETIIVGKLGELRVLIEDFFVFTKALANEEGIEVEEIDSNDVFEESVLSYYEDFTLQNRTIHVQGNQKVKILSNKRMLRRIFDNIIGNALQHSTDDVYITIEKGAYITYTFRNTINESIEVEHIFDEFYTSDISRTTKRTGLGLAIVKAFVGQLGGIVLARQEGNQLTIVLTWKLDNKE